MCPGWFLEVLSAPPSLWGCRFPLGPGISLPLSLHVPSPHLVSLSLLLLGPLSRWSLFPSRLLLSLPVLPPFLCLVGLGSCTPHRPPFLSGLSLSPPLLTQPRLPRGPLSSPSSFVCPLQSSMDPQGMNQVQLLLPVSFAPCSWEPQVQLAKSLLFSATSAPEWSGVWIWAPCSCPTLALQQKWPAVKALWWHWDPKSQ